MLQHYPATYFVLGVTSVVCGLGFACVSVGPLRVGVTHGHVFHPGTGRHRTGSAAMGGGPVREREE